MTEYRIVTNEGPWRQLSLTEAIAAQELGYNVLITNPPTPGGQVVTPAQSLATCLCDEIGPATIRDPDCPRHRPKGSES